MKDVFIVEIDRYIGLPIFFPIFKHYTINIPVIGFVKKHACLKHAKLY